MKKETQRKVLFGAYTSDLCNYKQQTRREARLVLLAQGPIENVERLSVDGQDVPEPSSLIIVGEGQCEHSDLHNCETFKPEAEDRWFGVGRPEIDRRLGRPTFLQVFPVPNVEKQPE